MSEAHSHTNPFYNRQRITDATYFYGREREIEALYSAVATRQCRSIVGERKMGKSSLLTHLSCHPTLRQHGFDPEKYLFIYVDLEGMANITYDEFWPELIDRLEMELPAAQTDLRQQAAQLALQPEIRFMQVRRLLRRVERAGLTVVLMLDEFESLATNAEFNASFYGELRSLAGELGVVYITASKRSLYDLTYQNADTLSSPFFNIFSEEPLHLLPLDEAAALLTTLSSLYDHQPFTNEQINWLIKQAGPHPFFLQVVASYLYEEQHNGLTDQELLDRTALRFRMEAEDHFRYLWNQLNELEQSTLLNLRSATSERLKQLKHKSLLRENEAGQLIPFSRAFADFLTRTSPMDRPIIRSRTSTKDLTGQTLGNYRVLSPVGQGGMATVYKGYQATLDRYVAIKVMAHILAGDQTFIERFQREAAAVARLRHQNIVQMYDFGLHEQTSYMVMEYIEGETLKQRLARLRDEGEHMSLAEVVKVVQDIAAALDYAHAHGIVHRDVKPANILLRPEERLAQHTGGIPFAAVLTDFGVARMLEGVQLTGTGATIGTPDYMSPEQAKGERAEALSDVYALGIILFEMLTGELPYTADTPIAVLLQHMQAEVPSLTVKVPHLPPDLEPVLRTALAKNPDERYATTGQLAEALVQAVSEVA